VSGQRPIGFLPAAGRGVRFGASGYAKELFPLLFEAGAGALEPRPIGALALDAIVAAGADRCVAVVSPDKLEIVRVFGSTEKGMTLAYVVQPEPQGIPDALRRARPWLEGADVVFAMPDTIFLPPDALREVHAARLAAGADVMLGVFPTDEPERLAPVELDAAGKITKIHDKPTAPSQKNTWGIASWSPRFTELCCAWDEKQEQQASTERAIGHAFEAARKAGLDVRARVFPHGKFLDIGTPRGLRAALATLATSGILVPDQAKTAQAKKT
jgi:glucose-1-phosphate thymidylyltransferase